MNSSSRPGFTRTRITLKAVMVHSSTVTGVAPSGTMHRQHSPGCEGGHSGRRDELGCSSIRQVDRVHQGEIRKARAASPDGTVPCYGRSASLFVLIETGVTCG